ncbi:MAG: hypothetical protein HQ515_13335, partial [Phycisphaeraceae bacterium]|nr:hypothetical protein [Phycisphaeraceae bacterium]
MTQQDKNEWLDPLLSRAIGSNKSKGNFDQWKEQHPEALETLTGQAKEAPATPLASKTWNQKYSRTKLAIAAVIVGLVFTALYLVEGSLDGTSKVYAAMIEALQHVQTVHITGWTHTPSQRHSSAKDTPLDKSQKYPIESWEWTSDQGQYRLYDRQGPITVWDDGHRRYEHQAHHDRLYISKARASVKPLFKQYQSVTPDIESFKKRGRNLVGLGRRKSEGTNLKGFRVESKDTRRDIWIDAETNLFVENKVFVKRDGQWTLYRHRAITYDDTVPDHIREYTTPKASKIEYSWDIAPRFEAWHLRLKSIATYYQTHPLPETMALWPRQSEEQMSAHGLGHLEGITDKTGFWATPVQASLADVLRSRIRPYGSLRIPTDLQTIQLNHDLVTNNSHTPHQRAEFVLNELGLELVEVQEERTVWVAHYNGQTLKPWDQVVAPVPRGDARATHPGMDFSSNPTTLNTLFES